MPMRHELATHLRRVLILGIASGVSLRNLMEGLLGGDWWKLPLTLFIFQHVLGLIVPWGKLSVALNPSVVNHWGHLALGRFWGISALIGGGWSREAWHDLALGPAAGFSPSNWDVNLGWSLRALQLPSADSGLIVPVDVAPPDSRPAHFLEICRVPDDGFTSQFLCEETDVCSSVW